MKESTHCRRLVNTSANFIVHDDTQRCIVQLTKRRTTDLSNSLLHQHRQNVNVANGKCKLNTKCAQPDKSPILLTACNG